MSFDTTPPAAIQASVVLYRSDPEQVRAAIGSCYSPSLRVAVTAIDNSPTLELKDIVESTFARYIHTGRNLGFGAAHNVAIRESIEFSNYHLVLNPDVHFDPRILITLKRYMDENPDVGLVMPRILYPGNCEQHLCKRLPDPLDLVLRRFGGDLGRRMFRRRVDRYMLKDLDFSVPRVVPALSGCFMFLRSRVLREVGLFDERFFMYMEDVDLCRRMGEVSRTIYFPEVSIYHGYEKGSYKDPHLLKHHVVSAVRYFQKWGWFDDEKRERQNREAYVSESVTLDLR